MSNQSIVEIKGVRIELDPAFDPKVVSAMLSGKYEEPELRALSCSLTPDDTVMELGTGVGLVSTYCAKIAGNNRVYTFEANPDLEPRIRSTYRLNGVSPQLEICMLTEHRGEQDFYVRDAFWDSSASSDGRAKRVVRIQTKPVNEQIRRIDPSVLVMDIEGGECDLMPVIDFHHIRRVIIEIHERKVGRDKADAVVRKLYESGFRINQSLSDWEICCFERPSDGSAATYLKLDEFLNGTWRLAKHWIAPHLDPLAALLSPGCRYALVDEDQWGALQIWPDRRRVPFTEHNGEYWGAPADDAAAIKELARLQAQGLSYMIFGPSALWWLDYYKGFAEHLRTRGRCILQSEELVAFALNN